MDGHLRLNLKTLGQHGKALYELIAEGPVSGHNVLDLGMEQQIDALFYQTVSHVMEGPLIFLIIGG